MSRNRNPLHAAAAHGTLTQLKQLLATVNSDNLINEQDSKGCTPLMLAAQTSNVEACDALLNVDSINVNIVDAKGRSALHYLAERPPIQVGDLVPYTDVLEKILDRNAECKPDKKGLVPLHTACEAGNYTAVSSILEHRPEDIQKATSLGWRPLHFAAKSDSAELVSMLLRRGAPVDAVCTLAPDPSSPQCTPLQVAEHFKSSAARDTLIKVTSRGTSLSSPNSRSNSSPSLARHSRSIRRTQGGADVKSSGLSSRQQPPSEYDQLPAPKPAAERAPAPLPNTHESAYSSSFEVDNEYDAVPSELSGRNSNALSQSAPPITSEGSYDQFPAPLVDPPVDPESEYGPAPPEAAIVARLNSSPDGAYGSVPSQPNINVRGAPSNYDKMPLAPGAAQTQLDSPQMTGNQYDHVPNELMQRAHAARQAAAQKNRAQSLPNAAYDRVNVGHSNNSYDRVNVRPAVPGYATGPPPATNAVPTHSNYDRVSLPRQQQQRPARRASGNAYATADLPSPGSRPLNPGYSEVSLPTPSAAGTMPIRAQSVATGKLTNSGSRAAPQLRLSPELQNALGQQLVRYYQSSWTRQDAEKFLANKPANTFVLRPTTNRAGIMTLSFVHPASSLVQHSLIYKKPDGFTFGEEFRCPTAATLYDLLKWQKMSI